jgi:glutathione peroxidase
MSDNAACRVTIRLTLLSPGSDHGRRRTRPPLESWCTISPPGIALPGAIMTAYDFSALTIDGIDQPLSQYRGHPLLIVNVASKCGFTPQYAGLEALYEKYHARGLEVLGFPCDQFGHQEPGGEAEIKQFCSLTYGVSFPMFAKIKVNGSDAHPLYEYLKETLPGILGLEAIKWNFTKFLVGKDGVPIKRYAPADKPESMADDVEAVLR